MKAILAAAAFAVMGAQADAAVYRLDFTPERQLARPGNISLFIDVPSFANLDIYQRIQTSAPYCTETDPSQCDYSGVFAEPIAGIFSLGNLEFPEFEYSVFALNTDASGSLTYLNFYYLSTLDLSEAGFGLTGYAVGTFTLDPFTYDFAASGGSWSVTSVEMPSPVPLPATAPMLLTGAALLFGLRRRFKA